MSEETERAEKEKAEKKKKEETDKIKKKMKGQITATNEKAAILSGEKEKIGKYKTKPTAKIGKSKKEEHADLDKFFKSVEEGFTDIKEIREKEKDKKPYDGALGKVEVERIVKTVNK